MLIRDRSDQVQVLKNFRDHLIVNGASASGSNAVLNGAHSIHLYSENGSYSGFYLSERSINGKRRRVLNFSTFAESTSTDRVSACLMREGGDIVLLHNGNVSSRAGWGRPQAANRREVDGRVFFVVGHLHAPNIFERVIEFHRSRLTNQS